MNYVTIPNIPQKPIKLAVVDGRISESIEKSLLQLGIKLIKTFPVRSVHTSVSFHPDIMLHHIHNNLIVCAPDTDQRLVETLCKEGFEICRGKTSLTSEYPGDIAYNVARVGRRAFHNLKYTDCVLRDKLENAGVEFINVNQGYSKCSISIVDECSIITADKGIAKGAEKAGIEVLLIAPDERIMLPGLSSGFIGGSTGLLSNDQWAIAGDINKLKCGKTIIDFLDKKGKTAVSLSNDDVMDIGTILPLISL